ncbi:NAD-dependent epimerase/dehydratase family protein [Paenibacillus doosanensis]|uniref:NAD-dependent epimerase/dehydratase family protein n=1 Tax=Paenibacillus doosanensis TaxID=1229154 RepID=UPI0021806436|nr:NAD-dependent epimerase/dehydratase family protein [Paenibacillus doosanensis]MCS7458830.1 NAD-dependent epimerase/dehydratase family protein [Paenibacillus doosanensis]
MKAIVTGGAGFIGSHLVEALLAEGINVQVIDNLSTGNADYLPAGVPLHRMDIRSEEVRELLLRERPDVVFHHAAQVDVQRSVSDPGADASVNIAGTANLVHACAQASVQKIIYASSCAVYGDLQTVLVHEDDPTQPISFYGISKLTPESYLRVFHRLYGLNYTILRYANVYGPRQTPKGEGGVVAICLDRLRKGLPLIVYGDGEQTRDFVYVKDVVKANLAAMHRGDWQTVQIGTAASVSVNRLVEQLQVLHGAPIAVVHRPERAGDIRHSCLSNAKAYEQLGWTADYDLVQGLKSTYEYEMRSAE